MLTGENGILSQAQNAKEKTTKAGEEEKVKMAVMGSSIDDDGLVEMLDETSFKNELNNQFEDQELDVVVNGDGSFIVTVKSTNRKYYVNDDKTVINSDNIVEIDNEEELKAFRDDVNNGNSYEGKVVLLTSDIDLGGEEWEPIGYYDQATNEKNPDTEINKPFRGVFDGGNNEINGIVISSNENGKGLFGFIVNSSIRNIILGENNEISGTQKQTGGIVGYLYGTTGNINNCINKANVNGNAGIVGQMVGTHTIFNCKNYGNINGAAGILGSCAAIDFISIPSVSIINCLNNGNISKTDSYYCGGIVGYFDGKEIVNCCNKGEILSNSSFVGGIAGHAIGEVINCYNIGDVEGTYCIGGIIGWVSKPTSVVKNCYFSATITTLEIGHNVFVGDGEENSEISNCYIKDDTFTASDLGNAFKEDSEGINNGYPILFWE